MATKTVLLIEDQALQRSSIDRELRSAGFDVVSTESAAKAREEVEKRREPFDIVVLDMNLEEESGITGAELGIEFMTREEWKRRPPEFLINSAITVEEDYYKQAVRLGVAAYLVKDDNNDLSDVVNHVRVLALRRALSFDQPDMMEKSRRIAESSRDRHEAVRRFCDELASAELRDSLSLDHLLLLTLGGRVYPFTNRTGLPREESSVYETVQALTHGKAGRTEPFVLDASLLQVVRSEPETKSAAIYRLLDQAALVPILADQSIRLSLGILPADLRRKSKDRAAKLAQLVLDLLRPKVVLQLMDVIAAFSEVEKRRRDVMRATASFCRYVGHAQKASLDAAGDLGEISEPGRYLGKLQSLAGDLIASGDLLGDLVRVPAVREGQGDGISMREVVESTWAEVSRSLPSDQQKTLELAGDCRVQGHRDYLQLAVGRILLWFVRRQLEIQPPAIPAISVICTEDPIDGPQVVIEDRSSRLPSHLRDQIFEPFASAALDPPANDELSGPGQHLALYLAKMLLVEGCRGVLVDQTGKMQGEFGHRFILRLPGEIAANQFKAA